MKKIIVGALLFAFGLLLTTDHLSSVKLGILEISAASTVVKTPTNNRILKGQKVVVELPSTLPNLGLVMLRFNTFGTINSDLLQFSIKELGQKDWYYQHQYKVDQFLPDKLFTFGFPPIENSQGKTFTIELESVMGTATDSVAVSSIEPIVVSDFQLHKTRFLSDKLYGKQYFFQRLTELSKDNSTTYIIIMAFVPFTLYCFWIFLTHVRNSVALVVQENIVHRLQHIDEFFLLAKDKEFPALDGLRGVAIIMVLMAHIEPYVESIAKESGPSSSRVVHLLFNFFLYLPFIGMRENQIGVNIFFCLSGFLIFMTLLKKKTTFLHFMYKRYARLVPTYFVVMMGQFMALPFIGMLLNLFFLVHFFPGFQNVNLQTWTLGYEILFYVLCGFWMIKGRLIPFFQTWKFTFIFITLLYGSQYLLARPLAAIQMRYVDMNFFLSFFFGVVLAKLYFEEKVLWRKCEPFFQFTAIPGLLIILFFQYILIHGAMTKSYGEVGTMLSWLFLNFGVFLTLGSLIVSKAHIVKKVLSMKYLRVIGMISYSMYLIHYNVGLPTTNMVSKMFHFSPVKFVAFIVIAYVINIFFSVVLFHYTEKPYFHRPKK